MTKKTGKKMGRPTIYNDEIAREICETIASSRYSVSYHCQNNDHWPCSSQVFVWLRRYAEFAEQYALAKEQQAETQVDYMTELMNEPHHFVDPESGRERLDVQMIRTKMDAIKWQAGKLKPKKYGDLRNIEVLQEKNTLLDEECRRLRAELDEKNRKDY